MFSGNIPNIQYYVFEEYTVSQQSQRNKDYVNQISNKKGHTMLFHSVHDTWKIRENMIMDIKNYNEKMNWMPLLNKMKMSMISIMFFILGIDK